MGEDDQDLFSIPAVPAMSDFTLFEAMQNLNFVDKDAESVVKFDKDLKEDGFREQTMGAFFLSRRAALRRSTRSGGSSLRARPSTST